MQYDEYNRNQESVPTTFGDGAIYSTDAAAAESRAKDEAEIRALEEEEHPHNKETFKGLDEAEAKKIGDELADVKPAESLEIQLEDEETLAKKKAKREKMQARMQARLNARAKSRKQRN